MLFTTWEVKPLKQFYTIILKSMNQNHRSKHENIKNTQVYQPILIRTSFGMSNTIILYL